jgi:hypothetical protein
MSYFVIILGIFILILLYVRAEQKIGFKESDLDVSGMNEAARNQIMDKVLAVTAGYLRGMNYKFYSENDLKNAIAKRIRVESSKEFNGMDVFFYPNPKKMRILLFKAEIKTTKRLWRIFFDVFVHDVYFKSKDKK